MHRAIGIFGGLAGVIVVALVARYGFVTSDTAIDGAIVAFFFGVIAIGGIAGPAVALHLFRISNGWAKTWGIVAGLIAVVALLANISNSLGAIAIRADKTEAQRVNASNAIRDHRTELTRIRRDLAALPEFTPTTQEAVDAARAAVQSAERSREAECKLRGPRCRQREADDRSQRTELAEAIANKSLTDRAATLEAAALSVRARLASTPPVKSANPLADTLARIFRMPAELAATGQQIAIVVVVEILIAFSLVAFELLTALPPKSVPRTAASTPEPVATIVSLPPAQRAAKGILALAGISVSEHARPLVADATSVARFMLSCMPRSPGEQVSWGSAYARYQRWCSDQHPPLMPLSLKSFGVQFGAYCNRAHIETRQDGLRIYCLDVKLAS